MASRRAFESGCCERLCRYERAEMSALIALCAALIFMSVAHRGSTPWSESGDEHRCWGPQARPRHSLGAPSGAGNHGEEQGSFLPPLLGAYAFRLWVGPATLTPGLRRHQPLTMNHVSALHGPGPWPRLPERGLASHRGGHMALEPFWLLRHGHDMSGQVWRRCSDYAG